MVSFLVSYFCLFGFMFHLKSVLLQHLITKYKDTKMSTATLQGLLDYLKGTLSTSNMLWLSERLTEYAKEKQEQDLKPYTIEEIRSMIEQSRRDSAAGLGEDSDEMFRELEEEFAELEKKHEITQTV